jgi:hypothetical protein
MVILNPANPAWPKFMEATNAAAARFAVEAVSASVRDAAGIERAFETFAREPNGGVIAFQDNLTVVNGELMVSLSNRHQLPFVTPYSRQARRARYYPTASTIVTFTGAQHPMPTAFCAGKTQVSFQCRPLPSSN